MVFDVCFSEQSHAWYKIFLISYLILQMSLEYISHWWFIEWIALLKNELFLPIVFLFCSCMVVWLQHIIFCSHGCSVNVLLCLSWNYFYTLFLHVHVPVMRLIVSNLEMLELPTKYVGVTGSIRPWIWWHCSDATICQSLNFSLFRSKHQPGTHLLSAALGSHLMIVVMMHGYQAKLGILSSQGQQASTIIELAMLHLN